MGEYRESVPGHHRAREGATAAARPTAVKHLQWETLGGRKGLKEAERKPPYSPAAFPLTTPPIRELRHQEAGQREGTRLAAW